MESQNMAGAAQAAAREYYYKVFYGTVLIRDSRDSGGACGDEAEARREAEAFIEDSVCRWKEDDAWTGNDSVELFDIVTGAA